MLLYCLRRNDEASRHTFRRRLSPSTNSAAYLRLVPSTCHGPSQLSILHLHLSTRWSQILAQNRDFCIQRPVWGGGCRNIAMTFNTEKLEWWGYRYVYSFRQNPRTCQTNRGTDTAWRHRVARGSKFCDPTRPGKSATRPDPLILRSS